MSISTYYKLPIKPRMIAHGRITLEEETAWRQKMMEYADSAEAKLEHARRVELSKRAAAIAAASPRHVSKQKTKAKKKKAR